MLDFQVLSDYTWPYSSPSPINASFSKTTKTYNSRDSLVVAHPNTNRPACGLNTVKSRAIELSLFLGQRGVPGSNADQDTIDGCSWIWICSMIKQPLNCSFILDRVTAGLISIPNKEREGK